MYRKYRAVVALGILFVHLASLFLIPIVISEGTIISIALALFVCSVAFYFDYNLLKHGLDVFVPPEILKEKGATK